MRAAVLRQTGDMTLDVSDIATIDCGPGQVRIKLHAAGICHSDLHGMQGTLPMPAPFVPGHEGAGVLLEVGEGVANLAVGDHVIVNWTPPCGTCSYCTTHQQPWMCRTGVMMGALTPNFVEDGNPVSGFVGTGTWTEELVTSKDAVVKIPEDIPFDIAALVGCGVTTGVGAAINKAQVRPGSNVVVFGAGGVGVSVIQGARLAGAGDIVVVDLNKEKAEDVKRFGATYGVTPDELEGVKGEVTGGDGFDYAFEAIGIPLTMRAAYDAARAGGKVIIIGAGKADDQVSFNGFELFYNEKDILTSYFGSGDPRLEFPKLLKLWQAGRLDLEGMVSARLGLDGVSDAVGAMSRGEVIRQIIEF
jgi:S-(hydroxymethyl)glutathione dehydrogenase / alcohol dehydrogenase